MLYKKNIKHIKDNNWLLFVLCICVYIAYIYVLYIFQPIGNSDIGDIKDFINVQKE